MDLIVFLFFLHFVRVCVCVFHKWISLFLIYLFSQVYVYSLGFAAIGVLCSLYEGEIKHHTLVCIHCNGQEPARKGWFFFSVGNQLLCMEAQRRCKGMRWENEWGEMNWIDKSPYSVLFRSQTRPTRLAKCFPGLDQHAHLIYPSAYALAFCLMSSNTFFFLSMLETICRTVLSWI